MKKFALAIMLVAALAVAGCCCGKCGKGATTACTKCPAGQCKCPPK
ncbi:MAG: hypothetical protein QGI24_02855 [Kiritimatiellia bacterium]|nr:hypothetical protein [Kiritimatiellia bacterium]